MRIWGKVLGFLFGFMLSKNIFGALLGLWVGHSFDKGRSLNFGSLGGSSDHQLDFFYTTFAVMGHIAKANGQVSSHEIAFATAYMNKLGLNKALKQQAQDAFREGKMAGFPLEERIESLRQSCRNRQDLVLLFLEIQIQVAFADGQLDAAERAALHKIAKLLGYSVSDLDKLLEMIIAGAQFHQQQSSPQQLDNAYKLLGVKKDTPARDIKKAYKKLMAQHHPDKLVAKGLPPEMMEAAKQKTQDIQAAYELVSKSQE